MREVVVCMNVASLRKTLDVVVLESSVDVRIVVVHCEQDWRGSLLID